MPELVALIMVMEMARATRQDKRISKNSACLLDNASIRCSFRGATSGGNPHRSVHLLLQAYLLARGACGISFVILCGWRPSIQWRLSKSEAGGLAARGRRLCKIVGPKICVFVGGRSF